MSESHYITKKISGGNIDSTLLLNNVTAGDENSPCNIFYQKSGRDQFWGSKTRSSECRNDIFETFVFYSGSKTEGF